MAFRDEKEFEDALAAMLPSVGWDPEILEYYDEKQLIQNWADILFANNRGIDRLNDYPLTEGEMGQILEQVRACGTPLDINGFINGRYVKIKRDNEDDKANFGKTVSLKIYDRREIAAGQSRYQIVRQPRFEASSSILGKRRGDLMLLINGMPVIHVELKKSGVPVSQACEQIKRYSHEGVFSGIFSLVQVFVAMNPEDAVYFANPGPRGKFNSDYYFRWGDADNVPITAWERFTRELLSIPMAHQLVGFYTVADGSDGILKVMRSYQYLAASTISDKVARAKWDAEKRGANQRGGYVWHTTGSGKTMTSFKSAYLIADSKDADKVIFLVDRIELGTQSLEEYRGFTDEKLDVQATENTSALVGKLKSANPNDTLIVTSIQKMSNVTDSGGYGLNARDLQKIREKRIVFIVDECHRSTFGEMLGSIKETFPQAMFFGFTGTPIYDENQKKDSTTSTIFGDELHRYTIADGIRDMNVLGFDPYKVLTFRDSDLREAVALGKAMAANREDALADPEKEKIYYKFMQLPMAGEKSKDGKYKKGIEDYLSNSIYHTEKHQNAVVDDILEHWDVLSHKNRFHAIFATHSIPEAIEYYRIFKAKDKKLKIAALFDSNIDNSDGDKSITKEEALAEIIGDYNAAYDQNFTMANFGMMKKDIASRLAHKNAYKHLPADARIDLLIVVDQMLTGFDSKWINTLYLDKTLLFENIIQALSRTNRLFGDEKPFGTIKYYRRPHTMQRNIEDALKLYSGDRPYGVFVDKLPANLTAINNVYCEIAELFASAGIENFARLPDEVAERNKFVQLFNKFNKHLEAARVQGFSWDKTAYEYKIDGDNNNPDEWKDIEIAITKTDFETLLVRYKELSESIGRGSTGETPPYDINSYITTISTDRIDADYMESRFDKFMKLVQLADADESAVMAARDELHKTFATLPRKRQRIANIILHDMQLGDFVYVAGKKFNDYIAEYICNEDGKNIESLKEAFGLDVSLLKSVMDERPTAENINRDGRQERLERLRKTIDRNKAQQFFEARENKKISPPIALIKADILIRDFIINGGYKIQDNNNSD